MASSATPGMRVLTAGLATCHTASACMVAVAQLAERQIVALEVAGSSPVSHPDNPLMTTCRPEGRRNQAFGAALHFRLGCADLEKIPRKDDESGALASRLAAASRAPDSYSKQHFPVLIWRNSNRAGGAQLARLGSGRREFLRHCIPPGGLVGSRHPHPFAPCRDIGFDGRFYL